MPLRWCSAEPLTSLRRPVLEAAGYRRATDGEAWQVWIPSTGGRLDRAVEGVTPSLPGSVLSVVPGAKYLGNKRSLWIRLVQAYGRARAETISPPSWLPELPSDREDLRARHRPGALYVLKDARKNRREGITVVGELEGVDLEAIDDEETVVQALVVDQLQAAGHHLSLRCWVVLVRDPGELSAHLYPEGLVVYAPGGPTLDAQWVTRRGSEEQGPGGAPLKMSELIAWITAAGSDPRVLQRGIARAVRAAAQAARRDLGGRAPLGHRCFELFGADFVIDRQLKPWLLELNRNPVLTPRFEAERPLREGMLHDAYACGGVEGFTPKLGFVEVGRWALG